MTLWHVRTVKIVFSIRHSWWCYLLGYWKWEVNTKIYFCVLVLCIGKMHKSSYTCKLYRLPRNLLSSFVKPIRTAIFYKCHDLHPTTYLTMPISSQNTMSRIRLCGNFRLEIFRKYAQLPSLFNICPAGGGGGVWTLPCGFSRIARKRRRAAPPGFHLPYPQSFWQRLWKFRSWVMQGQVTRSGQVTIPYKKFTIAPQLQWLRESYETFWIW